jgi:DNA-directed RNA polymerase specialized sigma subunit
MKINIVKNAFKLEFFLVLVVGAMTTIVANRGIARHLGISLEEYKEILSKHNAKLDENNHLYFKSEEDADKCKQYLLDSLILKGEYKWNIV